MSYSGPERRRTSAPFQGPERRYVRAMTDEEIQNEVHALRDRVEILEENQGRLNAMPEALAELTGAVKTLTSMVTGRLDGLDIGIKDATAHVDQATGLKTAIQFASVVLVPIILALIGGYFALRTGTGGGK